eukprot:scaffold67985_cov16-Tisochrysis_lutea.AAC.1
MGKICMIERNKAGTQCRSCLSEARKREGLDMVDGRCNDDNPLFPSFVGGSETDFACLNPCLYAAFKQSLSIRALLTLLLYPKPRSL